MQSAVSTEVSGFLNPQQVFSRQEVLARPMTIDVIARLTARLMERAPTLRDERSGGRAAQLGPDRIAVAVSHNDQKDHLRSALDELGFPAIRVDTANKLQGLEFDVVGRGIRWPACPSRTDSTSTRVGCA